MPVGVCGNLHSSFIRIWLTHVSHLQGTLTSVGPPDANAQSTITLQIDQGYPVSTLLLSSATLLAIPFDPVSGLLTTNTSDIYLPPPTSTSTDTNG